MYVIAFLWNLVSYQYWHSFHIEYSWKNILHSKCKCWMTRIIKEDTGQVITKQLPESNHSFAQCQCVWMRDGTRYSLTCRILQEELMVPIIWKLSRCKFMQTVESDEFTLVTDFIQKMNCQASLSCSYLSRRISDANNCTLVYSFSGWHKWSLEIFLIANVVVSLSTSKQTKDTRPPIQKRWRHFVSSY